MPSILIVDDEANIRASLKGALGREGWQVDEAANLANWAVPGQPLLGVGGAMDLASGARRLIVLMTHTADGASKVVPACTLPLTARGVVDLLITDLAVFGFEEGRLTLRELMPGATLEQVRALTTARFVERLG